jgi:hypothetical protein
MAPLVPKSNKTKNIKKGVQAPPMLRLCPILRLCDGVHIHQKQQNKNIKRGGTKAPHLSIQCWCLGTLINNQKK